MSSQITVYQTYTSYEKPKEVFKYNKRGNLKLLHIPDLRQHPQFPKFSTYLKNQAEATKHQLGDRCLVEFHKANYSEARKSWEEAVFSYWDRRRSRQRTKSKKHYSKAKRRQEAKKRAKEQSRSFKQQS